MDHQTSPEQEPQASQAGDAGALFHDLRVIRAAILLLAGGVGVAVLKYASVVLIPVVLAVFFAYVLNPVVGWLTRLRIPGLRAGPPRGLAALLVVVLAFSMAVSLGALIGDQFRQFAAEIVEYQDQIADSVGQVRERIESLQARIEAYAESLRDDADEPAEGLEQASSPEAVSEPAPRPAKGTSAAPGFFDQTSELWVRISDFVAGGLTGLIGFMAQLLTLIFVLYFALLEAPNMRAKVVHILGTTPERRRRTIDVLENVNRDIQRYLFNRFATNTVIAAVAMAAYWAYGMKYVLLLGVLAGLFNFVPYVGPLVGAIFPALIAYIQFGDFEAVFWVLVIYGTITGVEGNLVTPLVLGRHLRLNSLAVMLGLVFWGWLWGAIGMFLAIPILAGLKAVAENVDDLRPLGELLRG